MVEIAERLMDLAETRICDAGYNGFSFRELAADIGIKSASVHYHFPTKAEMAVAVVRRFSDRFLAKVAARLRDSDGDADVVSVYRAAVREGHACDGRMCLAGVLSAEAGALPPGVAEEMRSFFRRCVEDLSRRLGGNDPRARALQVMAVLEGALILARAYGDIEVFDQAASILT